MLVLQTAWILAVPPFRGIDEVDHVYKAASVARGDWAPTPTNATRGTGAWLYVPSDLVRAAAPQCKSLPYTTDADCVGTVHGDTTRIASGAGRYNPLYYAVVGTPALRFHGAAVDYAMRVTSLLLCWLFFCAALWATRQWARTAWPTTAIAIASTPVLAYSSTVVAPNGLEMMAGLLLWCAGVGVLQGLDAARTTRLVVMSTAGATVLVTTRSLGPVLCLLVLVTLIATRPDRDVLRRLARLPAVWVGASVVLAAALASTTWVLSMHALNIGQRLEKSETASAKLMHLFWDVPLWLFQTIAAFPFRDEPTRPEVYACYLALFVALAVYGFRRGSPRLRGATILAILISTGFPLALSAQPGSASTVWQGRYMLPYSAGIAILIGMALDRAGPPHPPQRDRIIGLGLFVVAQSVGPVAVLESTLGKHLSDENTFVHFSPWLVAAIAVTGSAMLWYSATKPVERRR
jgi:hypothetical protein